MRWESRIPLTESVRVAAAGMTAVMVPDMVQPDEEIRQIYDYCVQDLLEVKELIELNGI